LVAPDPFESTVLQRLRSGCVIPAHPLALDGQNKLDARRQRALTRYYLAAGAGGLAVGVHTTQFAIHELKVGLYHPVLELAAETAGEAVHVAEMDAAATDFGDASFDIITSIIMFHETSPAQLRAILAECWRLLRPGGLVIHLDVPYQPHRTPLLRQVTNHWQVRHNGEPFWTGFAETDMIAELRAAGFDADHAFADYEMAGPASFFFFGGRKPA